MAGLIAPIEDNENGASVRTKLNLDLTYTGMLDIDEIGGAGTSDPLFAVGVDNDLNEKILGIHRIDAGFLSTNGMGLNIITGGITVAGPNDVVIRIRDNGIGGNLLSQLTITPDGSAWLLRGWIWRQTTNTQRWMASSAMETIDESVAMTLNLDNFFDIVVTGQNLVTSAVDRVNKEVFVVSRA